jgi:hypothetical protein
MLAEDSILTVAVVADNDDDDDDDDESDGYQLYQYILGEEGTIKASKTAEG